MIIIRTVATEANIAAWFTGKDVSTEWKAAEAWIRARTVWPQTGIEEDGTVITLPPPDDLVEAVRILTHRYLERRSSPVGIIGMDDMGAVRLPGSDRDVDSLVGPWRPVVFG